MSQHLIVVKDTEEKATTGSRRTTKHGNVDEKFATIFSILKNHFFYTRVEKKEGKMYLMTCP